MVSIIILSYNTSSLLKNCLNSLYSHIKSAQFEVIVVDNASSDDSVVMLKREFAQVKVIENKDNVGFATGCNVGAKQATSEFLLFLNSDTEITSADTLTLLLEQMKVDNVGVVGGLMLNADKSYQRSFGSFYTLPHVAKMLFLGEKSEISGQTYITVQETDWVSGGYMMVKKSIFEEVKGFDEGYFMYMEDVDICYRIKNNGYRIMVEPQAQVIHAGQGSSNRTFAVVHIFSGLARFYKQHRSSVEYLGLQILLHVKAYAVLFFATIKKDKSLIDRYKSALSSL